MAASMATSTPPPRFTRSSPSRSDSYSSAEAGIPDDPTLSALLHLHQDPDDPLDVGRQRSRSPPPNGITGGKGSPMNRALSESAGLSGTPRGPSNSGWIDPIISSGGINMRRVGRAIGSRAVRVARRGNLPFLIIFLSCLFVFFSALAGLGYVDPDSVPPVQSSASEFRPGSPVFDADEKVGKVHEQRELERAWAKMKRPKDGAWMHKQRDDKAVRRVPQTEPSPSAVILYDSDDDDSSVVKKRAEPEAPSSVPAADPAESKLD